MRAKSKKLKDQMYSWLLSEMRAAEEAGMAFTVDGKPYSTGEAEELYQVMEEGYYMKSYVDDDAGRIVQVGFDHIESV